MTRLYVATRKVVKTQPFETVSFGARTARIQFATALTLECGHKVKVSGCGLPVHPPEHYGAQKCRQCPKEERNRT